MDFLTIQYETLLFAQNWGVGTLSMYLSLFQLEIQALIVKKA